MSSIEQCIRHLTEDGLQIHLWRTPTGYQANVKELGSNGWTCHTAADPIDALGLVLRQRAARVPDREVVVFDEPEVAAVPAAADGRQLDIEDAIAADDDFEGLL